MDAAEAARARARIAPTATNWSKDMVEQTNKRWEEFWKWCDDTGVPIPLREALLRDMLASIDAMRLATPLKAYIPALQGGPRP